MQRKSERPIIETVSLPRLYKANASPPNTSPLRLRQTQTSITHIQVPPNKPHTLHYLQLPPPPLPLIPPSPLIHIPSQCASLSSSEPFRSPLALSPTPTPTPTRTPWTWMTTMTPFRDALQSSRKLTDATSRSNPSRDEASASTSFNDATTTPLRAYLSSADCWGSTGPGARIARLRNVS